jgi:hypothetical protein
MSDAELTRAVVVTRGRTGSSAVTEELGGLPGLRAEQEVFSQAPNLAHYDFPPFEAWRPAQPDPDAEEAVLAERYLDALEADALSRGRTGVVWKALSIHFVQRPYLAGLIQRRGYKALYLRRGFVRQVLSGLVAGQRKLYNTYEAFEDASHYRVDPEQLRSLVTIERYEIGRDLSLLFNGKIPFLEVDYELYLSDRTAFFAQVCAFLGLPPAVPLASRFVVMIPDLAATIENLDEVKAVAAELGEPL